jgi:arabinose-5-phosphate isomerase
MNTLDLIQSARETLQLEQEALASLQARLDNTFADACQLILSCKGRVVVMGMGKSGHIGNKIAATLASTGTPSYFVHPAEASHGDIGMVTSADVVLALSNSGTTPEILSLLPVLSRIGVKLISITGRKESVLAQTADINLNASVDREACPLNLAPTTSTTVALALGDALAMALLKARGFTADDFAFSHPGGNLGKRLLLKVQDVMHKDTTIPVVNEQSPVTSALIEMSAKKLGMTTVTDYKGNISGVFTDGDLRRVIDREVNLQEEKVGNVMTTNFKSIKHTAMASAAARLMEEHAIYSLVVLDDQRQLAGIVTMHDLLQANVL